MPPPKSAIAGCCAEARTSGARVAAEWAAPQFASATRSGSHRRVRQCAAAKRQAVRPQRRRNNGRPGCGSQALSSEAPVTCSQIAFAFGLANGDRSTSSPRAGSSRRGASRRWRRGHGSDTVVVGISDDFSQLLQRPVRARVGGDVQVRETTRAVLDDDEHVQHPERGGDRNEEVAGKDAGAWFFRNVDQRWSPRGRPGGRFGMYLRTVLGEIRMPNLSSSRWRSAPRPTDGSLRHPADQRAQFLGNRRSAASRLHSP